MHPFQGLNWTKVGLKDRSGNHNGICPVDGLNWTKVGLKAVVRGWIGGEQTCLNWTKVGLKACGRILNGR